MKPELNSKSHDFIALARDYLTALADIETLGNILKGAVSKKAVPTDWRQLWAKARATPEYRKISQPYETLLAQAEKAADETQATELLRTLPSLRTRH